MFVATVFMLVVSDNEHTYLLIYMGNCLDMSRYATVYVMKIVYFQSDANERNRMRMCSSSRIPQ
jgi:hypothetical protein